jgi:hypothetical protein
MTVIFEIVFGIWFFIILLVVAFFRGSHLNNRASQRAHSVHEHETNVGAGLPALRRHGSDVG